MFADTYPDAEIILMGVEEPLILMHAPNESVDPAELATMAPHRSAVPPELRGEPLTHPTNKPARYHLHIERAGRITLDG